MVTLLSQTYNGVGVWSPQLGVGGSLQPLCFVDYYDYFLYHSETATVDEQNIPLLR